jgi:hypothetical protein
MAVDFRSILDVYPDDPSFTCVGTTKQGRRCRNSFIRNAYLSEANDLLDDLPEIVGSGRQQYELLPNLRRLAYLTLCPRWHQTRLPQVEPVAAKWLSQIQNIAVRMPTRPLLTPPPTPPTVPRGIYQSIFDHPPPPPPQTDSRAAVYHPTLYSPPATPPTAPRVFGVLGADRYPPPPHSTGRGIFYQPAFDNPPQPGPASVTIMSPPTYSQQQTSSNVQQSRERTSQTGRNVNINFNIAVDSNQVLQDRTRDAQGHDFTTNVPPPDNSRSNSSSPSPPSSPRSTTSSTSSRRRHAVEALSAQITALQAQMAALTEQHQALQAQSSSRSSRSFGNSTNFGSTVPSIISTLDLPSPRFRTLTPSPHSSRRTSGSSRSRAEPEDPNDSDLEPSSPSSSDSGSDGRPGGSRPRISTPSSGSSSPVIVSPPRSSRSASVARSAAPSPSIAGSAVLVSVQRRPLNADTTCYVCYDPIASEADAAWCRSSCGQNICLTCLMGWVTEQRRVGGAIACGFWYVSFSGMQLVMWDLMMIIVVLHGDFESLSGSVLLFLLCCYILLLFLDAHSISCIEIYSVSPVISSVSYLENSLCLSYGFWNWSLFCRICWGSRVRRSSLESLPFVCFVQG